MDNKNNYISINKITHYYHYNHPTDYIFYGHRHGHAEINMILSGRLELTCDDMVFTLTAGDIALIAPESLHQNRVVGSKGCEMIVVMFDISDASDISESSAYHLDNEDMGLFEFFVKESEHSLVIMGENELESISLNSSKLLEVIVSVLPRNKSLLKSSDSRNTEIYELAVKHMNANVEKNLNISDISRHCGVCRTTLKNIFSYYSGRGTIKFFSELKLTKAKSMLLEGMDCREVSEVLGYSSQAYFSKCFKDFYGIPPSELKK